MEFFQKLRCSAIDVERLQNTLTIQNLDSLCASITTVISEKGNDGVIYCIWGEFAIKREAIRCGVRFSLLNCPHALAWTVTLHEANQALIIHCTIDKQETASDFVESIQAFVEDWSQGLAKTFC